jgi:hypothetical protein
MQPWRASLWLLLGVWALACGGRYQQTAEGDDAPSAGGPSGVGGNTGAAGSGNSPGCACDPIACDAPFFREVPDASGCCYHCELDLKQCVQASKDYGQKRGQLINKYNSEGCLTDADCTVYYNQNQCGVASCGLPLLNSAIEAVDRKLNNYAQTTCSPACPGPADVLCPPPLPLARCIMSRCL